MEGRDFAGKAFLAFVFLALAFGCPEAGAVKWSFFAPGTPNQGMSLFGDRIFVTTDNGWLVSVNRTSGLFDWETQIGNSVSSNPFYSQDTGIVYAITSEGGLYGVDPVNGIKLWTKKLDDVGCGSSPAGNWRSSPYVDGGIVFVGSENGCLYAFNASDKTKIWSTETNGSIRSAPIASSGRVYVGSGNGTIYSFDARNGNMVWRYNADGAIWTSSPAIYDKKLYIGSVDGKLYALNAQNGKYVGEFKTDNWIAGTPLAHEGAVYFGSNDNYLYAVDAQTLSLRWKFKTGNSVQSLPLAVPSRGGTTIVFGSNDGTIYAVRATSGNQVWKFAAEDWAGSPLFSGNMIYVPSYDGRVYSLSPVFCEIDSPKENTTTGNDYMEVRGRVFSDSGVRGVRVRVNHGPWNGATGTDEWSVNLSLRDVPVGRFSVECSALDSGGREEPQPYERISYEKTEYVPPKEMQVNVPQQIGVGETFSIQVLGDDGTPVQGAEVRIPKKSNYAYKTNERGIVELSISETGKQAIEIEKEGYVKKTVEIEVSQGIGLVTYLYIFVALIAVAIVFFELRKRRKS